MRTITILNTSRIKSQNWSSKNSITCNSKRDLPLKREKISRVTYTKKSRLNQISISLLMKTRKKRISRFTTKKLPETLTDTLQLSFHMKTFIFRDTWIPRIWLKINCMRSMPTTVIWLICTLVKSDLKTWTKLVTFLLISIKLNQLEIKMLVSITCSLSSITDGESQPEHGSQRPKNWIILKLWRIDLKLITTITIKDQSMMLNGLKIKSSLMLLTDLVIQFLEKSQLKRFLVLREHQLIQVINSNHSFKLHLWTLIQHSALNQVKSFMRTRELLNG